MSLLRHHQLLMAGKSRVPLPPGVPPGTVNFTHAIVWEAFDVEGCNVTYAGMQNGGWTASQNTLGQSSGFKLRGVGTWFNGFTASAMFIYMTGRAQFGTGNGRVLQLGVAKGANTYRPSSLFMLCTTTPAGSLWSYNAPIISNPANFVIATVPNGAFVTDYSIQYIGFLNPSVIP